MPAARETASHPPPDLTPPPHHLLSTRETHLHRKKVDRARYAHVLRDLRGQPICLNRAVAIPAQWCDSESRQGATLMIHRVLTLAASASLVLAPHAATAQLAANQTVGFGNGRLVTFTYLQNFDCVDQPTLDLDLNRIPAQSDPNEMQTPICQPVTEPTADPSGAEIKHTAHLYVLIPMFSVDQDQNPNDAMPCPDGGRPTELCGPALGAQLIALFGAIPEAWKTTVNPAITTQCPDPNHPVAGTCTMHASSVDLSQTLVALKKIPAATAPIFVPTPNHSHVVDNSRVNAKPIWWEVRPVLVFDQSDWPAADGSSGITSSEQMDAVEAAGRATEVGSNFFLFFSSRMGDAGMKHPQH
jgi:hypothetical protein